MQPVTFQCGHCGNLMAVTADMVGQQVRCPTCQQVVIAPAPAAISAPVEPAGRTPGPSEQAFQFSSIEEKESIFTPDEQVSEDVFGAVPRPVLEAPPPSPPPFIPEPPAAPTGGANPFAAMSAASPPARTAAEPDRTATRENSWAADGGSPWTDQESDDTRRPRPEFDDPDPPRIAAPRTDKGGWFVIGFVIPLISYSVLMTFLAIIFYYRMSAVPHPFEALPDTEGENKGAARRTSSAGRTSPINPVPAHLRVGLNQSITIGDLEVKPTKVEKTTIRYVNRNGKVDPDREPTLVLHLSMRNVSKNNVTFKPTDPYFLRVHKANQGVEGMPYTILDMGSTRFPGGPLNWGSDGRGGMRADVYLEGQNASRELAPDNEMTTLVCTNPSQRAPEQAKNFNGRFLWRVQVRRGLVQARGRDVSATAVIGVEFTKAEIQ